MSDSVRPHGLQAARLLCPWDSPGKNSGVGCHSHLQVTSVGKQGIGREKNYKVRIVAEATSLGWLKGLGSEHGRRAWPYELHFPKSLPTKHRSSPGQRPSTTFARFSQEREQFVREPRLPAGVALSGQCACARKQSSPLPFPPSPGASSRLESATRRGTGSS